MSCKVSTVYSRPNEEVKWHKPVKLTPALEEKYGDKRFVYKLEDADNLMSIEVVWDSKATLDAFMAEPEIVGEFEAIKEYHEEHGILTVGREVTESDKPFMEYLTEG